MASSVIACPCWSKANQHWKTFIVSILSSLVTLFAAWIAEIWNSRPPLPPGHH
jgi:hypothetical protein